MDLESLALNKQIQIQILSPFFSHVPAPGNDRVSCVRTTFICDAGKNPPAALSPRKTNRSVHEGAAAARQEKYSARRRR